MQTSSLATSAHDSDLRRHLDRAHRGDRIELAAAAQLARAGGFSSYVYFARCGGFVKIGIAQDVQMRVAALQTSNPLPVILLGYLAGGAYEERRLHRQFKALHHRGEWFRLEGDLAGFIAEAFPSI